MATTKLVIRPEKVNKRGCCVIYVLYTHLGYTTYFSTGEKIEIKDWDKRKCQVKIPVLKESEGQISEVKKARKIVYTKLNDLINRVKYQIDDIRMDLQYRGIDPTVELVNQEYQEKLKPKRPSKLDFFDYEKEYLKYKRSTQNVKDGTIRHINSCFSHMRRFEEYSGRKVSFKNMNENFYEELMEYFFDHLDSAPNTVGGQVKLLKTYLNWTLKMGYNSNQAFKTFRKPKSVPEIIALDQEELSQLFEYDLSSSKRLERVRDMFVFACATGLRYSDFNRVTRNNIQGDLINIRMVKTKNPITIPLTDYSKAILEKYDYDLPKISNQNFNVYLREAGEKAGLDNKRDVTKYNGNTEKVESIPLHQLLRSHIGRKTFVSLSLNRMSPRDVMAITGHKDFSSFERYVTASPKRLKEEMNKTWKMK